MLINYKPTAVRAFEACPKVATDGGDRMLYQESKAGGPFVINDHIDATAVNIRRLPVKLGLTSPQEALVLRRDIYKKFRGGNPSATEVSSDFPAAPWEAHKAAIH